MKLKTSIKAGSIIINHNQSKGLALKTAVKAGGLKQQHNQSKGLSLKTAVKAGLTNYGARPNHNQTTTIAR